MCTGDYEVYDHAFTIFESMVDDISYGEKFMARNKLDRQEQIELTHAPGTDPKYDRIHFIRDAIKLLD
jgi:hypothetical protein